MSESECTWDVKLADIVWGINNTYNATTGTTPFSLMFGHSNSRFPAIPTDEPQNYETQQQLLQSRREQAKLRIDRNMTLMKSQFDKKRKKCRKYSIGQLVLWKGGVARDTRAKVTRKLDGLYTGPYRVCRYLPNATASIQSPNTNNAGVDINKKLLPTNTTHKCNIKLQMKMFKNCDKNMSSQWT